MATAKGIASCTLATESKWGITVIRAIAKPLDNVYSFRLSGFAICDTTLSKLYTIHFLLPLLRIVLAVLHIALLHGTGSTLASMEFLFEAIADFLEFGLYFGAKDSAGLLVYLTLLSSVVCCRYRYVSHPDNSSPASPTSTPSHIAPEYYFLAAYSVLKSIPLKETGFVVFGLVVSASIALFSGAPLVAVRRLYTTVLSGRVLPSTPSLVLSATLQILR